jgi:hypothetical protein
MTYGHDMLPFTSSWTPVCPQQETGSTASKAHKLQEWSILDFKLSPRSECCILWEE